MSGRHVCVPECVVRGRHSVRRLLWAMQQFVALFVCLPRQRHKDNNNNNNNNSNNTYNDSNTLINF